MFVHAKGGKRQRDCVFHLFFMLCFGRVNEKPVRGADMVFISLEFRNSREEYAFI